MQTQSTFPSSSPSLGAFAATLSISILLLTGCGGAGASSGGGGGTTITPPSPEVVATPVVSTSPSQNGAVVVTLADSTSGATIHYTTNGTVPGSASTQYLAPFLVASNVTLQAIGIAPGDTDSAVASQTFAPNIPSGTLVWSDEFKNATNASAAPNASVWSYDTGGGGWGNSELEDYCAYGSTTSPCDPAASNEYVGTDGALHLVARQPSAGVYTSARMKTEGLFSFQYGRLEFRAQLPEAQGFWPAGWLLGNNIATINWPGCGEMDVLERVNAATIPDFNEGSIHGPGFTGTAIGDSYSFPSGQTAATWHTYGMIWQPGTISYYVDDPTNIYATFNTSSLAGYAGATWPFDNGPAFLILNLAVGGSYPGNPNASTPFPSEYAIDYVRIYTN
jgi:beta-glucanase (GH16 family)